MKKPKIIKLVFIIDLNLTLLINPLASYGTELILTTAGTKRPCLVPKIYEKCF
jgi:hypothetical protein